MGKRKVRTFEVDVSMGLVEGSSTPDEIVSLVEGTVEAKDHREAGEMVIVGKTKMANVKLTEFPSKTKGEKAEAQSGLRHFSVSHRYEGGKGKGRGKWVDFPIYASIQEQGIAKVEADPPKAKVKVKVKPKAKVAPKKSKVRRKK